MSLGGQQPRPAEAAGSIGRYGVPERTQSWRGVVTTLMRAGTRSSSDTKLLERGVVAMDGESPGVRSMAPLLNGSRRAFRWSLVPAVVCWFRICGLGVDADPDAH